MSLISWTLNVIMWDTCCLASWQLSVGGNTVQFKVVVQHGELVAVCMRLPHRVAQAPSDLVLNLFWPGPSVANDVVHEPLLVFRGAEVIRLGL